MAPEQIQGEADVGTAADIWALGAVLYEALTLSSPFSDPRLPQLLTSIISHSPAPLLAQRPDIGEPLAALVHRMLQKNPERRPQTGAALLRELAALSSSQDEAATPQPRMPATWPPSDSLRKTLSSTEQRVQGFLLVADPASKGSAAWISAELQHEAVRRGASFYIVRDGSLIIAMNDSAGPIEDATRLSRLALSLRALAPGGAFLITTRLAVSEGSVIHELVASAASGEIRLDDATASLLESRFEIQRQPDCAVQLLGERQVEAQRTLLGQHTSLVGRRRELDILHGLLAQCTEEGSARAALVTAPPGMGKSRLQAEFVRSLVEQAQEVEILIGYGDSMAAGAPYLLLGSALRRRAGINRGDPIEVRRQSLVQWVAQLFPADEVVRISAFLGEVAGVPFPSEVDLALVAARREPSLMANSIAMAWERFLSIQSKRRPVLLILDDAHHGDLPSMKLVERALSRLHQSPILVLALARPEVRITFPQLFAEHPLTELRLEALGRKACEALIRQVLGSSVSKEWIERAIEYSGGNAFFLEEIIRAAVTGAELELPETVLGMLQARICQFGPEARRVLQVASVFGERFRFDGLQALLGDKIGDFPLADLLSYLCDREILVRLSGSYLGNLAEHAEYRYQHALVREAAYEMLTIEDRKIAHRAVADFLEVGGDSDPRLLAEHLTKSQELARAIKHYLRAAERALHANDLSTVLSWVDKVDQAGAGREEQGRALALRATVSYWQGHYAPTYDYAVAAIALLRPGSAIWFQVIGQAAAAAGRQDRSEELLLWHHRMLEAQAEEDAACEQIVCLSRCCLQWHFLSQFERCDELMHRLNEVVPGRPIQNPLARAQYEHACSRVAATSGDTTASIRHMEVVIEAFEQAGDIRNMLVERASLALLYSEIGQHATAEGLCRSNLTQCEAQQVTPGTYLTKLALVLALSGHGDPHQLAEARQVGGEALHAYEALGYKRLQGVAHRLLASVEIAAGNHAEAQEHAQCAVAALASSRYYLALALATLAKSLVRQGRAAEALPFARQAMDMLNQFKHLDFGEITVPLVLSEALAALGQRGEANQYLSEARARLLARAEKIADPAWRQRFLGLADHARILRETERALEPSAEL